MRVIAVDWSGDTHTAQKHIWLAEATQTDRLVRLECGRDRSELCAHLLALTRPSTTTPLPPSSWPGGGGIEGGGDRDYVIGLDFAFSFPGWFVTSIGAATAPELWAHAAMHGEQWLAACEPPFWGRPGKPRPPQTQPTLRQTDSAVPRTSGIGPKSVFQVGGAGAVGTGSVRGMPLLQALYAAGARVWPFTDNGSPVIVEIYPRLFTGPVRKSNAAAREALLSARYPTLREDLRRAAIGSEDAFDAAVSALEMVRHADALKDLPTERDATMKLEGRIWHPHSNDDGA